MDIMHYRSMFLEVEESHYTNCNISNGRKAPTYNMEVFMINAEVLRRHQFQLVRKCPKINTRCLGNRISYKFGVWFGLTSRLTQSLILTEIVFNIIFFKDYGWISVRFHLILKY